MAVTREDLRDAEAKLAEAMGAETVESFHRADGPGIMLHIDGKPAAEFKSKAEAVLAMDFATGCFGRPRE